MSTLHKSQAQSQKHWKRKPRERIYVRVVEINWGLAKLQGQSKYLAQHSTAVQSGQHCSMQSDFHPHLTKPTSLFKATSTTESWQRVFVMQFPWPRVCLQNGHYKVPCRERQKIRLERLHKIDLTALDEIRGLLVLHLGSDTYNGVSHSVPVQGAKQVTGQPHYTATCGIYPRHNKMCKDSADLSICEHVWDIWET